MHLGSCAYYAQDYICTCPFGYSGVNCETKVSDPKCKSNNICENNGKKQTETTGHFLTIIFYLRDVLYK